MPGAPLDFPKSLQGLPPEWAHFCLGIEKFIKTEIGVPIQGARIVTAFSGGVDSTALLLILHYLSTRNGLHVIAAHLNHMIREEASEESRWVRSVCDSLGIECVIAERDVPALASTKGVGLEEAGRMARYDFFAETLESTNAQFIAVGHHLDDLCEDVLMRLSRGTGWPALSGMDCHDPARKLIRPFLLTPKSTLADFVTSVGLEWKEDPSNASGQWMRNRVRNDILPLFLKENPNFPESIARLWKIGRLDRGYWDTATSAVGETIPNEILESSHQALRLRLYKAALEKLGEGQVLADTVFKLDLAWETKRVGTVFQFPGEKTVTITASGLVFSHSH